MVRRKSRGRLPWPEPVGGYRLRRYSTLEAYARGGMVHAFRTRKLMMVPYARFLEPRDETQLSPHSHVDFEQGSVAMEGEWVHHLRVPWTPDKRSWRPDVHLEVGSPSTTIIPAGVHPYFAGHCRRGHAAHRRVRAAAHGFLRAWLGGQCRRLSDARQALTPVQSPAVQHWLTRFALAMEAPASVDVGALFGAECYWRDFVAFSWNIITLEGTRRHRRHAA